MHMTAQDTTQSPADGRVARVTFPTASFTLTSYLIAWIAAEADRRGVSKSVLVREILTAAMEEQERDVA
jgi:hypothetical protein